MSEVMKLDIPAGKYVIAVSGGVDSMALLDMSSSTPGVDIVVAHFNHGIRDDSSKDESLVRSVAKHLKLPVEVGYGHLGAKASEATARQARYDFLDKVMAKYKAQAVMTAHHQDDLIETAIINMIRGTGWRGLVSMLRSPKRLRPLLGTTKKQISDYAKTRQLDWREDVSNSDEQFLRNRIRSQVMPKLKSADRVELLEMITTIATKAPEIQDNLQKLSAQIKSGQTFDRRIFAQLPSAVADELMREWLVSAGSGDVDRSAVSRLSLAAKNAKPGTIHNAGGDRRLQVGVRQIHLL